MFAIITFRDTGPIKTWSAMRATNVHNARTKPLDHAVPGAPRPRHLIGGRDLVADVKCQLRLAKIDPDRMRKNGVIAYEAIMTASPAFFEQGAEDERRARLESWTKAQVEWATKRYGMLRVASMVLHVDEKTPHVHLVVVPLEVKSDKRRADRDVRWSLVGRTISGPGKFDDAQDAYSAAMAPFGLARGVRASGRKHEPVPVYLARLAAKERDVDCARDVVRADAAGVASNRAALDAKAVELERSWREHAAAVARHAREDDNRRRCLEWDREAMLALVAADRTKVAADKVALENVKADHATRVAAAEHRIAFDREALRRQEVASASLREELRKNVEVQRSEVAATSRALQAAIALQDEAEQDRQAAAADRAAARIMAEEIEAHRTQLLPTLRAAADFRTKVAALKGHALVPAASSTQASVRELADAVSSVTAPPSEGRPGVIAIYQSLRQAGASLA